MTLNELNKPILLEKSMEELADEFALAKKELRKDVDVRITLESLKSFIKDWRDYAKNFNIQKKRITVIQEKGKELIKYLQNKINNLKKVKTIDSSEITPLQDYLDDFKIEVETHIDISTQKYTKMVSQ
jgi:uncharacterized membrane protein YgaE (UPF0421/DUF939 family)